MVRSDYPNQINNVCAFPYIFRGAIDCRATEINTEMKKAATAAIASLAKTPAPFVDQVSLCLLPMFNFLSYGMFFRFLEENT